MNHHKADVREKLIHRIMRERHVSYDDAELMVLKRKIKARHYDHFASSKHKKTSKN